MSKLFEVITVFFKLGCTAFGGPAVHIAMMQREVVERRGWLSHERFLDLVGATNLIPGPNSTEMTMHCGHERAGWPGLIAAGLAFILPAVAMTTALAWVYNRYGDLPDVAPFFTGIKPAVIAVITAAVYKLGQKAVKGPAHLLPVAVVFGLALSGISEIVLIVAAGLLGTVYFSLTEKNRPAAGGLVLTGGQGNFSDALLPVVTPVVSYSLSGLPLYLSFLKVGSILYGSGYVLFAYLDAELVSRGLLTSAELVDAVAVGQFTPGPLLSTAAFVGYRLDGLSGALLAAAGIFTPSFLFVALLNPLVSRLRKSPLAGRFLDAVNGAAVAVMAAVTVKMAVLSVNDISSITIAVVSFVLTFGPVKLSPFLLICLGAGLGRLFALV